MKMRYSKLLSVAVIAVLLVVMASCTVVRDGYGEYGEAPVNRRAYFVDPYTGQMYLASPYGYYSPYDTYGYSYGYPYNYNRGYYDRGYSNRGGGTYQKGKSSSVRPSLPKTQDNTNANKQNQRMEEARKRVLGERKQ